MKIHRDGLVLGLLATGWFLASAPQTQAEPLLQLYMEGATYDSSLEAWAVSPGGSSAGAPFRIWAIGNVSGPGSFGTIRDVRMAVAYDASYLGVIEVGLTLVTDPNPYKYENAEWTFDTGRVHPQASNYAHYGGDINSIEDTQGQQPRLSDGKPLAWHGVYGPDTVWQEFDLGDFHLSDSPIADFIYQFPTEFKENRGQINVYDVTIKTDGDIPGVVYFDLYNHVEGGRGAAFAPYSHTAQIVPAPATLIGFIGLLPILVWRRVK